MARQQAIKTWPEFLRMQESYETKMTTLRSSILSYVSPRTQRPAVWVALIDPQFASECLHFFHAAKNQKQVTIPTNTAKNIRKESAESYISALSVWKAEEKIQKISTVLSIFAYKRPDIGYHSGMNFLVAILLEVFKLESDIFLMLCHIIEKIYPEDYFIIDNRKLGLHRELRIFAMMAEKLRPKLVATLKAVFHPKNSNTKVDDLTPFVNTIKRIGFSWFSALFVKSILPSDLLRVWDNILIHGFEFAIKFALTILSKYEKFLRTTVKAETKAIGLDASVDTLTVAGNLTRIKLMQKLEKMPIEKMIKKAIAKSTYRIHKRNELITQAENLEKLHLERLYRLRQSKILLRNRGLGFSFTELLDIFHSFDQLNKEFVSREEFLSILKLRQNWISSLSINIFSAFDQYGNDSIELAQIKIGLALLSQCPTDEKLSLCYQAYAKSSSEDLYPVDIFNLICCIEKTLDYRSEYFKTQSSLFYDSLDLTGYSNKVSIADFVRILKTEPASMPIYDFINAVEANEYIQIPEMKIAQMHLEGTFSDIHSPLTSRSDSSHTSEISTYEDDPQNQENDYFEMENPETFEIPSIEINENIGNFEEIKNDAVEEINEDTPNFEKMEEDFDEEKYETIVRAESLAVEKQSEFNVFKENHNKRKIELPEPIVIPKESRPGCSRLCIKDTCELF
ncbi:TBC1D2_2 [Blepharisma stoltei]|uniref:Rab-GAP TBC domain-containing protein n=1 Tax=Blepharisma stoltei TaxID=1481888 RepID=A0AAU9J5K8_9CILI|nr:unnamed protein product [Blepharisma stoltei]